MFGLSAGLTTLLLICLTAACIFEFINGFHDTANAVATVIYTHSLRPVPAVIWSGFWNFLGVNVGGIAVAVGIINLLPIEALVDAKMAHSISMIAALILTAIIWNLGTWYFGIPCSSSHTLIGSIFGVGIAYMLLPGATAVALNWKKISEIGLSLLISPFFGFLLTMLLIFILQKLIKNKMIFKEPPKKKAPPLWLRSILILTCTGVSFSHGSNDGQKGVGLVMIILIAFSPAFFAINRNQDPKVLTTCVSRIGVTLNKIDLQELSEKEKIAINSIVANLDSVKSILYGANSFNILNGKKTFEIRKDILLVSKAITKFQDGRQSKPIVSVTQGELAELKANIRQMKSYTEYSPRWVILMISLSLGFGTMIGWKRIVVTIGEKIGKSHLTYAQGASAEIVAASTIGVTSWLGLPVSTTHVLSSGIAGSMVAGGGMKNLQRKTITNIAIAWLITLPVTVLLSGTLFLLFRMIFS
jgi:low-affinity inorganic phosphate transporter